MSDQCTEAWGAMGFEVEGVYTHPVTPGWGTEAVEVFYTCEDRRDTPAIQIGTRGGSEQTT